MHVSLEVSASPAQTREPACLFPSRLSPRFCITELLGRLIEILLFPRCSFSPETSSLLTNLPVLLLQAELRVRCLWMEPSPGLQRRS